MNNKQHGQGGFTLIELLVTLVITSILILFVMNLFERTIRVSGTQAGLSDLQQNQRVVQRELTHVVRQAGRGGLLHSQASHLLPTGPAVSVRTNVTADETLVPANADTPTLVAGTDVLTIRGVQGTLTHLEGTDPTRYGLPDAGDPLNTPGFVIVKRTLPLISRNASTDDLDDEACSANMYCQPIELLADMVTNGPVGEALILMDSRDSRLVAVVNVTGGVVTTVDDIPTEVRINFDRTQAAYQALAPLSTIATVGLVGILEEWRYFVKKRASPVWDNPTVAWKPVFTKARFVPNTDTEWNDDTANFDIEIAENVEDFQIALGIDKDASFIIDTNDNPAHNEDEWLFDDPGEDRDPAQWNTDLGSDPERRAYRLRAIRITTLASSTYNEAGALYDQTENVNRNLIEKCGGVVPTYRTPFTCPVEDRPMVAAVGADADPNFEVVNRYVRRRQLQTVIDMRNLQ